MSLADLLMQLQEVDRYGGDFGHMPEPETAMSLPFVPPTHQPASQGGGPSSGLMALALARAGGGGGVPHGGGPGLDYGGAAPSGRGVFFNDQVDVLQQDDPRLVTHRGVTLARPAWRSLRDALQEYGYHGDPGGGYRTAEQQAGMNPALAAPVGQSYHQEGVAIDLAAALQNARFSRLMQQAGWNQFSPQGEPWHWSFGVTG